MVEGVLALRTPARALAGALCFWRVGRCGRGKCSPWSVARAVGVLSEKIKESGFNPDVVVSVGKDGSNIGEMLVRKLGLISLTSLHPEYDWRTENSASQPPYLPQNLDANRLRILLFTEAVNTGETLKRALDHVSSRGPKAVRTASIFQIDTAEFVPDYYIYQIKSSEEIPLWRWRT